MRLVGLATLLASALSFASPGFADAPAKRFALLIANKTYEENVGPLRNPRNDVELLRGVLQKIGFERADIEVLYDAKRRTLMKSVDAYARRLGAGGGNAVGFFYYAGHGSADKETQTNYLIPVDVAELGRDTKYDSVPLSFVIESLQRNAPKAAHFVVFDACRNELGRGGQRGAVNLSFVREDPRQGMLIAFSTDTGATASDGNGDVGPYAAALAHHLATPNVRAGNVFTDTKLSVYAATDSVQFPWHINKFRRKIYINRRTDVAAKGSKPQLKDVAQPYFAMRDENRPEVLRTFVKRHPKTVYAALARDRIATLTRGVRPARPRPGAPRRRSALLPENLPSQAEKGDYFVIAGSFTHKAKASAEARVTELRDRGFDAYAVDTDNYANFRDGLWAVVLGPYNKDAAREKAKGVKRYVPDAYVKSGDKVVE